ncbi:MAG: TetR/AcrR family transcriptional regulator [Alphaproteobacteria bacterium]
MAYRRTEAVEQRLDNTRSAILRAARAVVAEEGFGGATQAKVAARAGVATGTLYKHFPSKDALGVALYQKLGEREMGLTQEAATHTAPADQLFREAIDTFVTRAFAAPGVARAMMAEPVGEALARERLKARERHAAIYQQIIERGVAEGIFPAQDAALAAECTAGAIVAIVAERLLHTPETHHIPALISGLQTYCLAAISGARGM